MSKRRRRIFSREFKLSAIERMLGGESTKALSRELRVGPKHLHKWCHRFRTGGAEGVRQARRPRKQVVGEEERAKSRVAAAGSHAELLSLGGLYARLAALQFDQAGSATSGGKDYQRTSVAT